MVRTSGAQGLHQAFGADLFDPFRGDIEIFHAPAEFFAGQDFDTEFFMGRQNRLVVYDTGDWSRSLSMHTTGQSGHPYHPNYDDQIDPWRLIEMKPMLWTREQVEANAANRLVLRPAAN